MARDSAAPNARHLALDALVRIDSEGAYANVVLPSMLSRSTLDPRDRRFVTDLVYGTTRRRRALDFVVDRFLIRDVDVEVRAALRLGAYQLYDLGTPPHAAVAATVDVAPNRARGFVNAVLRRVAEGTSTPIEWPDDATRLSYPDWIVERLVADLGHDDALAALAEMNEPSAAAVRDDGYVQDEASQWVAAAVGVQPGERIADLCAAPGGKATFMAGQRATVLASDVRPARARTMARNAPGLAVVVADGRRAPYPAETFDRVLVDAPCSGLGVLRRRPDARWRIEARDVERLAQLQRELLDAAVTLVRPGGRLVYSVCTLTIAETAGIDTWMASAHEDFAAEPAPGSPWQPLARGARVLPQTAGTDGMAVFLYRRVSGGLAPPRPPSPSGSLAVARP
jgi:16S rRNA (cytosine967-C5)-methyltransferase